MAYRRGLPNGDQGPVQPENPDDALAALLGLGGGQAAPAEDPSLELANLRGSRADELKVRMAKDAMAGDKNDFSGSKILLDMLQGDMANDPTTGNAARVAASKAAEDEYQANGMLPNQVRNDAREFDLKKVGEPARVAGEYGNKREEIAQEGALERQKVANEGLIGAAHERASAAGGQTRPLASGLMERVAGGDVALQQLGDLRGLRGGVSIGPAAGRFQTLMQSIPLLPADKNFAAFKANTDTFKNSVIKAVTGAQMSEKEAERIMGQIPTENDKDEVWDAKAGVAEKAIKGLNIRIGLLQQGISPVMLDTIPVEALADHPEMIQALIGRGGSSGASPDVIDDPNWGIQ